jgi:hypothetical protein
MLEQFLFFVRTKHGGATAASVVQGLLTPPGFVVGSDLTFRF